jgi:hypothetical protein
MQDANRIHNTVFTLTSTNGNGTNRLCLSSLRNSACNSLPTIDQQLLLNGRFLKMRVQTRDNRGAALHRYPTMIRDRSVERLGINLRAVL